MNKLQYLAGFFDGEGCITAGPAKQRKSSKITYKLSMALSNSDIRPLFLFKEYFGGSIIEQKSSKTFKDRRKHYLWQSGGGKCNERCLKKLLPFLITKKEVALAALEFRKYVLSTGINHSPEQKEILRKLAEHIRELNHGKSYVYNTELVQKT